MGLTKLFNKTRQTTVELLSDVQAQILVTSLSFSRLLRRRKEHNEIYTLTSVSGE